jgi:hypothetical protein
LEQSDNRPREQRCLARSSWRSEEQPREFAADVVLTL